MPDRDCRIGVVLHGPEIIDSGCALKLIEYLQRLGRVKAVLGGTMGRVALMDAGLQDTVRISPRRRPSQSIQDLEESSDIIFSSTWPRAGRAASPLGPWWPRQRERAGL